MSQRFIELTSQAYDYDEAMKRQNLQQKDVDKLRDKVKSSKFVPKFYFDKQVNETFEFL